MVTPLLIQAANQSSIDIARHIESLYQSDSQEPAAPLAIRIEKAAGQDGLLAGLRGVASLDVQGEFGDFGLCALDDAECRVDGNAGDFFCHSIKSGSVILKGHAGRSLCSLGCGGFVAIYGSVGARLAIGLQGTEIVIRGSAGELACLGMKSGCVVIGGNAGNELGKGMTGGAIFVRGDIGSISSDIEEIRVREPDRLKIGLLMIKAGIKSSGKEFRLYRSVHEEVA